MWGKLNFMEQDSKLSDRLNLLPGTPAENTRLALLLHFQTQDGLAKGFDSLDKKEVSRLVKLLTTLELGLNRSCSSIAADLLLEHLDARVEMKRLGLEPTGAEYVFDYKDANFLCYIWAAIECIHDARLQTTL